MKIGAVLLASGLGRRFGSNKLLTAVEGIPLYRRAMTALAGAGFDRLAVCSPYQEVLSAGEALGFLPLYNPDYAQGISASVRLGAAGMAGMDGALFSALSTMSSSPKALMKCLVRPVMTNFHGCRWVNFTVSPIM